MNAPHISRRPLPRRTFLRGSGAALALPLLECMTPVFARPEEPPRRMLIIANNLGVLPKNFFPHGGGRDYTLSPYLTVHGGEGKINPLVAPREVLLMLPGVDPAEIDRALNLRQRAGADAQEIARALDIAEGTVKVHLAAIYRLLGVRTRTEAIAKVKALPSVQKRGAAH